MNGYVAVGLGGILGIFAVVRFAQGAPLEVMVETFAVAFFAMFIVGMFVSTMIGYFFTK